MQSRNRDRGPTTELTFADLPPLPEGVQLMVRARATAVLLQSTGRTFRAETRSGPMDAWFVPDGAFVNVVGGCARVPVGDGPHQLSVWLFGGNHKGWKQLQSVQPAEIPGGPGRAPCAVSLSADEVRTIAAEVAATGK